MFNYMVRVEIFGATLKEYSYLNESMGIIDFRNTIRYNTGELMALPTGSYVGLSSNSAAEIRDKVKKLASPLSSKPVSIFVCRYSDWAAFLYSASVSSLTAESES
ncbi:type V toxin-antitoxin system endoribonuclease antitoxin GhoS [Xenorhabdus sp. Vera]|uniref:type V toxin-antitoxin system endoribonuclease antitoxin GhoS n=1 Tax=Xenorhabdus TaxID=626 RepID=UPI0019AF7E00|nr:MULTISPECIES: type V toxin-antitoxin system endoribonuclease antitoxin GhoS [unclassified Xenorhabdus]MBD2812829.1 type V toxin-antitoxin system endoribonuclease antitoxin GhoS [Xenorhabdus sp. Vera]